MDTRVTRNVADPRTSLAMWLRAGRAQRKLTLDDVARVTKIQPRILEKIEAGNLEGLPADVFVRGFVKSFARCVGLDVTEAGERYGQCANASALPSVARAFVETLVAAPPSGGAGGNADAHVPGPSLLDAPPEILPSASIELTPLAEHPDFACGTQIEIAPIPAPVIEVVETGAVPVDEPPRRRRSRKKSHAAMAAKSRKNRSAAAAGTGVSPVVPAVPEIALEAEAALDALPGEAATQEAAAPPAAAPTASDLEGALAAEPALAPGDGAAVEPWQPTMPAAVASAPWKRPASMFKSTISPYALPSLVIDDADPDNAERAREDRESAKGPQRVSFLPPILLDREDKSGRQGGLTLAVILLLIAATLTLSYLMRRPSVSGDGVTRADVDTTAIVA